MLIETSSLEKTPVEKILILFLFNKIDVFSDFIKETIIKWAKGSFITDNVLVRSMFDLIFRQYNALGEVIL
jgi:hypothetical protein